MRMLSRIIMTVIWAILCGFWITGFNTAATLGLGKVAGNQFNPSDTSYLATQAAFRAFNFLNVLTGLVAIGVLALIWYRPLKNLIAGLLAIALLAMFVPQNAFAYYADSDYTENYFILPNESAFFVPDVGDNISDQASFGSEAYYAKKKIAAKRFEIPHTKLPNSGIFSNKYVPAGRLIVVDRTPVSREWVKAAHRGTGKSDQSFPCQDNGGLDITVGVAVGASVFEDSASKFLYRFGTNAPEGDRKDPNVVFTSVYYGRSLAQVMDGPVRSRVQALVCDEISKRPLPDDNTQAAAIMTAIEKRVGDYMSSVGISLDFIGWADTFEFEPSVQAAINRKFEATQDLAVAQMLAPHTATLQSLASAEAVRTLSGKWNGAAPTSVSLWWLPTSISDWVAKAVAPAGGK